MTEQTTPETSLPNGWRIAGWSVLAALLALPAIAMQLSQEVEWTTGDFVVAGLLLGGLGLMLEGAVRFGKTARGRLALAAMAVLGFLIVWIELAVGLFGPG